MRNFRSDDFPAERVLAAKRGRRVSVCMPARDEEATVGGVIRAIQSDLVERWPIVDEVVVVDDGSSDGTAAVAAASGARVIEARKVLADYGTGAGKGQAMWKAVHCCGGDVIVFCDADIRGFDPRFVLGLLGPLLTGDDVVFVKGCYERPLNGRAGEGGRVTELMARPLISVFFPHLSGVSQPLAGECAAAREVFEAVPFVGGYGVDLALLIDVTETFGVAGAVQCDLGTRVHRNRPLSELSVQALAVLQAALHRAGLAEADAAAGDWTLNLLRPGCDPSPVPFVELPPLASVPAHRKSA